MKTTFLAFLFFVDGALSGVAVTRLSHALHGGSYITQADFGTLAEAITRGCR